VTLADWAVCNAVLALQHMMINKIMSHVTAMMHHHFFFCFEAFVSSLNEGRITAQNRHCCHNAKRAKFTKIPLT
jgi:hypothetical protein